MMVQPKPLARCVDQSSAHLSFLLSSSFILKLCPLDGHFSFPSFLFIFPPSFHDSSKPNFLKKSFAFFPPVFLTRLVHISIFDCCFNRTRSVPPLAKENPPAANKNPTVVAPAEPDPEVEANNINPELPLPAYSLASPPATALQAAVHQGNADRRQVQPLKTAVHQGPADRGQLQPLQAAVHQLPADRRQLQPLQAAVHQ
jgi:hypothetical protein